MVDQSRRDSSTQLYLVPGDFGGGVCSSKQGAQSCGRMVPGRSCGSLHVMSRHVMCAYVCACLAGSCSGLGWDGSLGVVKAALCACLGVYVSAPCVLVWMCAGSSASSAAKPDSRREAVPSCACRRRSRPQCWGADSSGRVMLPSSTAPCAAHACGQQWGSWQSRAVFCHS